VVRTLDILVLPVPGRRAIVAVPRLDDARDRDLVRQVRAGDEGAFRSLFRRYAPVAKGLALRIVRQAFLAEEIVQEAFLVLWRDPGAYREDLGTFRVWLLATVHHRAVDAVRREETYRRRTSQAPQDPVELEDIGETVVDGMNRAGAREEVRRAVAELPEAQRRVLEMMYFDGKTQSTIAEELGVPLGTVKSRTLLAMRRLRTRLGEEDG